MRRAALLALCALAGCARTFPPAPAPDAGPGGPTLAAVEPGTGFAGETVLLRGAGFAPGEAAAQGDLVRFGSAIARVVGGPDGGPAAADLLAVEVPDLGPAAAEVAVSVTVGGRTAQAPGIFRYRGPGHPTGFGLTPGADLSPTPTHVAAFGGVEVVSLLRNDLYAAVFPQFAYVSTAAAGPGELPFATAATLAIAPDGAAEYWLWGGGLTPGQAGLEAVVRGAPQPAEGAVPVLPEWFSRPDPTGRLDPFALLRPAFDGAVRLGGPGAAAPPQPGLADWALHGAPLASAHQPGLPGLDGGPGAGVAPFTDLLVALYQADGGPALARTLAYPGPAGPLLADAGPDLPLALPPDLPAQPFAVSLSPAADRAYVTYGIGPFREVLAVSLADGASAWAVPATLAPADAVVAAPGRLATWSQASPEFLLRDAQGAALRAVTLPGLPLDLERDAFPPFHLFAAVASPPVLVEVEPEGGAVVSTRSLANGLAYAALSPDGARLAVGAAGLPALAVLDALTLEERPPGFTHAAPPGEPEQQAPGALAFLEADGGEPPLCAVLTSTLGFEVEGVRCGPAATLLRGPACALVPGPLSRDALGGEAALAPLPGGGVRVFGAAAAWDCQPDPAGGGCPTACGPAIHLGEAQAWEALEPVPGGGAVLVGYTPAGRELLRWSPDGTAVPLCQDLACGALEQAAAPPAVDRQGRWAAVSGHVTQVYELAGPRLAALITFFSDIPTAQAFSPDGRRLYVGTTLGHLYEYDLAGAEAPGPAPARLQPTRSLFAGFPVRRILAQPDGSRLLLFDQGSDRIFVVH